jgi:hypothetical protein
MVAPGNIINHRRELCKSCPTPCEFQTNLTYRSARENGCPIGRWQPYLIYKKNQASIRGAGDLVAAVAQPIAGAIDYVTRGKTKLKGCSACAKRKEMLNHLLPFGS